jgi:hypothetical protein
MKPSRRSKRRAWKRTNRATPIARQPVKEALRGLWRNVGSRISARLGWSRRLIPQIDGRDAPFLRAGDLGKTRRLAAGARPAKPGTSGRRPAPETARHDCPPDLSPSYYTYRLSELALILADDPDRLSPPRSPADPAEGDECCRSDRTEHLALTESPPPPCRETGGWVDAYFSRCVPCRSPGR